MEWHYIKERMEEAFAAAAACQEMAFYWQEHYHTLDQVDLNQPWFQWGDPPTRFVARWDSFQQNPPACYEVDTLSFSFFPLLFLFSYIYTYKDHSLQSVVCRPYSGLTFPLICFTYQYLHLWTAL